MIQSIRQAFFGKTSRRPYRLFQIEPALDCSLECVMCPWSDLRVPGSIMAWDTFERIQPYLPLAEKVDLTGGGEPLKNPHTVEMVAAAKVAGCQVGFSTNATRLNMDTARRLLDTGLDWISFSIDAATPELYESIRQGARFSQVIDQIAGLRDLKRRLGSQTPKMMMVFVVMTGAQQNYHELPAFIELAVQLGVEQVIAKNLDVILKEGDDERRVFSHQGDIAAEVREALQSAQETAQQRNIGLRLYSLQPREVTVCEHYPLESLFINWEGIVSPCITLSYAENRVFDGQRVSVPCQRFGNIRRESLEQIWNLAEYREFRSMYQSRLNAERQATLDHLLGGPAELDRPLPPAPQGCRTCYYLYGV